MRSHTFALLTALALVLVTAGEARPAGSLPDEIVFHDSNLAITDVSAPRLALTGKQFTVDVEVTETTGNAGASTQVDLLGGESPLRSKPISIPPAESVTVSFPVTLSGDGSYSLEARLPDSPDPGDDNSATAEVDVTQFRADVANVLLPSLVGYGGQWNHSLFLQSLNPNVPPGAPALAEKIETLEPQILRIFFPLKALTEPEPLAAFIKSMELARETNAVINVTFQSNFSAGQINANMARFAGVLEDLVENRGVSNLRWVTLVNEANMTAITMANYERMYRVLDLNLRTAGVRDQIRFMGGDLVQDKQRIWFQYMAANMADVLDAYSVHIYWSYWDTDKIRQRLEDVRKIDVEELPAAGRKPIYVMEYGVRGIDPDGPGPLRNDPGVWADRTPMAQTNISAFQMGWFNVHGARLGYPGSAVWDLFKATYDPSAVNQDYSLIGPGPDYKLRPAYYLLRLFTATTEPGWRIVGVDGEAGEKLLTAYDSPDGKLTVVGLDRAGGQLNDASGGPSTYTVAGLPTLTTFKLVVWNGDGSGRLSSDQELVTDALGIAHLTVPQHAVWSLTTHPIAD
jgi:hypothetical protein